MEPLTVLKPSATSSCGLASLPMMVSVIGNDQFCSSLLTFLGQICGADHISVFRVHKSFPVKFAHLSRDGTETAQHMATRYVEQHFWRRDPAYLEAQRLISGAEPVIVRLNIAALEDAQLRDAIFPNISEKIVIYGGTDEVIGLSVLHSKPRGRFSDGEIGNLGDVVPTLMAILIKHAETVLDHCEAGQALSSVVEIEGCVSSMTPMPRREAQVCARVVYGMSSCGIAIDLGMGEESVKTYRKRLYSRLNIGCERELVMWYLRLWDVWRRKPENRRGGTFAVSKAISTDHEGSRYGGNGFADVTAA